MKKQEYMKPVIAELSTGYTNSGKNTPSTVEGVVPGGPPNSMAGPAS